jgi:lipid-binding SYLF domain-containing protein
MYNNKFNPMLLLLLISLLFTQYSLAAQSASQLDAEVDIAIDKFKKQVNGGENFLPKVKGYLVFPSVIKAGLVFGGKYGRGALRIDGVTKNYYSLTSASIGWQAGAQEHAMLIAFLSEASLQNFIHSNGWEAGVDGSIAVSDWGKSKDIGSISFEKPIIAFIYDEKGLMASVSVAGTKFQKIIP